MLSMLKELGYVLSDYILDKARIKRRLENVLPHTEGKQRKDIEAEIHDINREIILLKNKFGCSEEVWEYFSGTRKSEPSDWETKSKREKGLTILIVILLIIIGVLIW
jgi:hypothetical protein